MPAGSRSGRALHGGDGHASSVGAAQGGTLVRSPYGRSLAGASADQP